MISSHEPAILLACVAIAGVAALTDFFTKKIPNILTLGGLVLGLAAHGAIGFVEAGSRGALRGVGVALAGAVLCALIPFISFVRGSMGGGDVKLFAAIGAMTGISLGIDAEAMTFGILLLVVYPWNAIRSGMLRAKFEQLRSKIRGESVAPEAVAKLPRVILAPTILVGLCLAIARAGAIH